MMPRLQRHTWTCGPAALANAIEVFERRPSERRVADACGTTQDGTDEKDLISGAATLGYRAVQYHGDAGQVDAWRWLLSELHSGGTALLYFDGDHWVTALGINGPDRVLVFDPYPSRRNKRNCGLHILSRRTLFSRWFDEDGKPFAISVRR